MPAFLATCGILKLEAAFLMVPICAPFWSSTFHIPWKPQNFKADSINDKYHRGPWRPILFFAGPTFLSTCPSLQRALRHRRRYLFIILWFEKQKWQPTYSQHFATNSTLGARIAIPLLQKWKSMASACNSSRAPARYNKQRAYMNTKLVSTIHNQQKMKMNQHLVKLASHCLLIGWLQISQTCMLQHPRPLGKFERTNRRSAKNIFLTDA